MTVTAHPLLDALTLLLFGAGLIELIILFRQYRVQTEAVSTPAFRQPFTLTHAALAMLTVAMLTGPALLMPPTTTETPPPGLRMLLIAILFQQGTLLAMALACLYQAGVMPRQLFFPRNGAGNVCRPTDAWQQGIRRGLAALPLVWLTGMATTWCFEACGVQPETQEVFDWLTAPTLPQTARALLVAAAIGLAPLVEELFFRGVLLDGLAARLTPRGAIMASALVFALAHAHAESLPALTLFGLLLAAGYRATGSLITPMVMHLLFNLTSMLAFFAQKS